MGRSDTRLRDVHEHVQRAFSNYAHLPPRPFDQTITPETFYLATPDRLAYALGWVVANQIVQARFRTSGIDALPVFHPEHGWDRFLLTRRMSGRAFHHRPANEFGMLLLDGEDSPRLASPGGTALLALRQALCDQPSEPIRDLLALIPQPPLGTSHENRIRGRERAPQYPVYFNAVTELILEHPGLVAAREVYIDDEQIDGQYHPLYLHAVELTPDDHRGTNLPQLTYNWFQLQIGDLFAFFDRRGTRAVYRTDRGTWRRVTKPLIEEPDDRVRSRIAGWLRLDGATPDPAVD